ncbi:MAG: hypothetical protein IKE09_07625 [Clostridiales bacterium]|nr:hypothetical protein [Clostridiales bacterium]
MKLKHKSTLYRRTSDILRSKKGASIVFVSIIAIIVLTAVVVLRTTTSSLWASADKQYYQDRACVMATSMGSSIDALISDGTIKLDDYKTYDHRSILVDNVDNGTVTVTVTYDEEGSGYLIEVTAELPTAKYVYRAFYYKSGSSGSYKRQIL